MSTLYSYKDSDIYCHHSLDCVPLQKDFPMHAHDQMEIYCFFSGKGKYLVEGTAYDLSPGDVIIVRQAETHKILISSEIPYERTAIHFSPSLLKDIDERLMDPFFQRPLGIGNHFPASEFPELSQAFHDLDFHGCFLERTMILSRILWFLSMLYDVRMGQNPRSVPKQSLSEMVNFVNEHLFDDISTESMGKHFSKSASQFSRDFLRATGSPFWKYVIIKRLLSARALLQRGESAQKAANLSGFSDYSTFYRAYKKQFGCAPSEELKNSEQSKSISQKRRKNK